MMKDTPDGQTYHDPEAERKAREPMQDLIKESASELKEYIFTNNIAYKDKVYAQKMYKHETNEYITILDWHTKQMEKAYEKGRIEGVEDYKEYQT